MSSEMTEGAAMVVSQVEDDKVAKSSRYRDAVLLLIKEQIASAQGYTKKKNVQQM